MFVLYLLGPVLILIALGDAVWTTLWVDGGAGPVTSRVSRVLWRGMRRITRDRSHRALSLAGPVIVLATALVWLSLLWCGWMLLYSADPSSVLAVRDRAPADVVSRAWFVSYTLSTLGNGDYVPRPGEWQLVTGAASVSGLFLATLGVSYMLSVLGAVVEKRAFAGQVIGIGEDAVEVVLRTWDERDGFRRIEYSLDLLVAQLGRVTEQHLAYPVLHYYHGAQRRDAATLAVAVLDEALLLMEFGVAPSARPGGGLFRAARSAVDSYLETLSRGPVDPASEAPPAPDLGRLAAAGIPTVPPGEFASAVEGERERRSRLGGLLDYDALDWPGRGPRRAV